MKKLLIVPLIVLSSTLFAQKFQFGLKGGLNISNFTNTSFNNVDNKAILGAHGGALPLRRSRHCRAELTAVQADSSDADEHRTLQHHGTEIPSR